ncbi:MAG: hypothetical protein A2494_00965 [Candidatus Lloydbacteria bacterium RIFOXYC12_FULL_46_25]|uniref:Uncharacterized protein n=1 Tax=Candidatus Lloydbacteria bacterium RIFOXYC12_FULL_46_25 TaxID=1798670 RepID=A0A1G2E3K4_9BACT|nr:MAG: hypothetical protein A2494_00965 [Candidatus Lloydbacteria bacterium RIFOXYC12_FULL_46_25]
MLLGAIFALTLSHHMPISLPLAIGSVAKKDAPFLRRGRGGNKAVMRASKKRKQQLRAKKVMRGAKNRR